MDQNDRKKKILRFGELAMKKSRGGLSGTESREMDDISRELGMSPQDILKAVAENLGQIS